MQGDAHGCWYIDALLDVPESQLPMCAKLHFKKYWNAHKCISDIECSKPFSMCDANTGTDSEGYCQYTFDLISSIPKFIIPWTSHNLSKINIHHNSPQGPISTSPPEFRRLLTSVVTCSCLMSLSSGGPYVTLRERL